MTCLGRFAKGKAKSGIYVSSPAQNSYKSGLKTQKSNLGDGDLYSSGSEIYPRLRNTKRFCLREEIDLKASILIPMSETHRISARSKFAVDM